MGSLSCNVISFSFKDLSHTEKWFVCIETMLQNQLYVIKGKEMEKKKQKNMFMFLSCSKSSQVFQYTTTFSSHALSEQWFHSEGMKLEIMM